MLNMSNIIIKKEKLRITEVSKRLREIYGNKEDTVQKAREKYQIFEEIELFPEVQKALKVIGRIRYNVIISKPEYSKLRRLEKDITEIERKKEQKKKNDFLKKLKKELAECKSELYEEILSYKIDFREMKLFKADLSETDLSGVDLSKANLFRADLSNANLGKANFSGAVLWEAVLDGTDLSGAIGIEAKQLRQAISLNEVKGLESRIKTQIRGIKMIEDSIMSIKQTRGYAFSPSRNRINAAVLIGIFIEDLYLVVYQVDDKKLGSIIAEMLSDQLKLFEIKEKSIFQKLANIDKKNYKKVAQSIRMQLENQSFSELCQFGRFLEQGILSTYENKMPKPGDVNKYLLIARKYKLPIGVLNNLEKLKTTSVAETSRNTSIAIKEIFLFSN